MIFPILYYTVAIGGIYYLELYTNWLVIIVLMAVFLSGMQWGELVEKIQVMFHLWKRMGSNHGQTGLPH